MPKTKKQAIGRAVKIDHKDYDRICEEAKRHERGIATQLRIIFRERYEAKA